MMVSIEGLSRTAVLAALFNASHAAPFLHLPDMPMSVAEADKVLRRQDGSPRTQDYIRGRRVGVRLERGASYLDATAYDAWVGEDAAEAVVESLRQSGDVNNTIIQYLHTEGVTKAVARRHQPPGTE